MVNFIFGAIVGILLSAIGVGIAIYSALKEEKKSGGIIVVNLTDHEV